MAESLVSVVTVTLNNADGLAVTLQSLAGLTARPLEIIVVDGSSTDGTREVVDLYISLLPIVFLSERDAGIYDAMNKGRRLAKGDVIHYLNAGDRVFGEPYASVDGAMLLDVRVIDEHGTRLFTDFVKHGGYGYCHQGILFPRDHPEYRCEFRVAADFDAIIATFPSGLNKLRRVTAGGAEFDLGGISTQDSRRRDREMRSIVRERLPFATAAPIVLWLALKSLVPRPLRRLVARRMAPAGG